MLHEWIKEQESKWYRIGRFPRKITLKIHLSALVTLIPNLTPNEFLNHKI